ncbi:hypothetical protein [Nocardia sp. NPDC057668]|uniref:hypothetical protein n=1 Tax=Nocardia sp. NPDC057668 TaxID=3346202 RepID=UPI00366ADE98
MSTRTRRGHRIAWGTSALAAASAAVAVAAPQASAALMIDPQPNSAGNFVVGEWYAVVYEPNYGPKEGWIVFTDNDTCFRARSVIAVEGTGSFSTGVPSVGRYSSWSPQTPGTHVLKVVQGKATKSVTVTVLPSPDGTPPPAPTYEGCDDPRTANPPTSTGSF